MNLYMSTMQTTDAPTDFIYQLWPWLEANKVRLAVVGAAIIIVAGVYYFVTSQHEQREIAAGEALTQALIEPSRTLAESANALIKVAESYTGTEAAKRATLQAGASFFAARQYTEAQTQFQKFLDGGGSGPLAATAELGLGASLEAQGKLDPAVTAYQRVISSYPGTVSDLPAYCGLGRIAEAQGHLQDALNDYTDALHIGGQASAMSQSAYISGQAIKAKLEAAAKTAGTTKPATTTAAPAMKPTLLIPSK
jgi:predicted negative regulator of RcsB-dependent stress response